MPRMNTHDTTVTQNNMVKNITFKYLTDDDYEIIAQWRNSPEVRKWYYDNDNPDRVFTAKDIFDKEDSRALENPRFACYIILLDGIKAGFIQTYLVCDYPDYNAHIGVDDKTAAIDIFLAPEFMYKGYGKHIMTDFLERIVFSGKHFAAEKCMIGPDPKNKAAIRMYEKVGFRYWKTVQIPDEQEPEYTMLLYKMSASDPNESKADCQESGKQ
jgi:RimJ/RimL family protein N-acetyltransferase